MILFPIDFKFIIFISFQFRVQRYSEICQLPKVFGKRYETYLKKVTNIWRFRRFFLPLPETSTVSDINYCLPVFRNSTIVLKPIGAIHFFPKFFSPISPSVLLCIFEELVMCWCCIDIHFLYIFLVIVKSMSGMADSFSSLGASFGFHATIKRTLAFVTL